MSRPDVVRKLIYVSRSLCFEKSPDCKTTARKARSAESVSRERFASLRSFTLSFFLYSHQTFRLNTARVLRTIEKYGLFCSLKSHCHLFLFFSPLFTIANYFDYIENMATFLAHLKKYSLCRCRSQRSTCVRFLTRSATHAHVV